MLWCPFDGHMGHTIVSAGSPESSRHPAAEAALLLAVATCPALIIPFASHPFEPHKAAFLWMTAAAACAAVAFAPVVVWGQLRRFGGGRRLFLLGLACAMAGLCLLATFSEAPHLAWWGSILRRYGAATQVSLLAVLGATLLAASGIRAPERLLDALILGSVGPTVYAIAQALRFDPLTWDLGRSQGNSTFGNWLFFAGYVAAIWPLTVGRAMIATRRALHDRGSRPAAVCAAALWILLGLQSAALALAGSRGPLLALVATVGLAAIVTVVLGGRRLLGAFLAGLAFVAAVVFLVVVPPRMAAATARAPQASSMTNAERSAVVRLMLWDAVGTGLRAELAAGTSSALVGSGPESTTRLITRHARPGMDQLLASSDLVPDRAHNATLETLATMGLAGLVLQLLLLGLALVVVMSGLGLLDRADTGAFVWFESAMLCGTAALAIWRGGGLGALAVVPPAAAMLSVTGWIVWRPRTLIRREPEAAILLASAAAAALVHFIDIHLSVATIGSALTAAVAGAVALNLAAEPTTPSAGGVVARSHARLPEPALILAVLAGWSAAVLTIGLAGPDVQGRLSAALIVTVAWLLSLAVVGADRRGIAASGVTWATVSAVWFLWPAAPDAVTRLSLFYVIALACLAAVALLLSAGLGGWRRRLSSAAAPLLAGGLVAVVAVRITSADVYEQAAMNCTAQGDADCASTQLRNALDLNPMNDQLLTQWAQTLMARAEAMPDPAVADGVLVDAERALRQAQAFDPFNYQHPRNVAALQRRRARLAPAPDRMALLGDADRLYRTATELFPSNGVLWVEWANVDAERRQAADALAKLNRAAELGADGDASRLADALLQVTTARAASSTDLTRIAAELRDRGHARLADLYARRAADATLR